MKNSIFKTLLILIFTIGSYLSTNASHLLGGEITWECANNGDYIFTLTLYQDCNGNQILGPPETINNPAGTNIVCTLISETDISPSCWNPNDPLYPSQITCQAAINNPPGNPDIPGAVKKFVFRSGLVSLNGVPPVNGWEFSWSDCCRPSGNQNTNSTNYYLRAKMYPYIDANGLALNTSTCYDNSPFFAENGSPVICTGNKFVYNHLAADVDLDSLAFGFADPLTGANNPVVWNAGFSSNLPYPDGTEDPSNGPVTLNAVTGEMTMDINSFGTTAAAGSYASCVKIEAWRCGQLIAEVFRDVAISMQDNCPGNTKPSAEIDTALFKTVKRLNTDTYYVQIYPGDTIDFNLSAQDFDFLPNGTPQTICFEAGGLEVSSPSLGSGTGCLGASPCAKINPVSPQTGYCQGLQNTMNFFWTPTCDHLGFSNGCGSPTSTYYFTLKMTDDGCPAPAVSITTLIVDVLAGDPNPPVLTSLFQQTNGDIDVKWNQTIQDSALDFNYYKLFGSSTINGNYVSLDSIPKIDSLQTTIPSGSGYKHFYLIKSTGACDFLSGNSDTLSLIEMNLAVSPPSPNSRFADLQWNAIHNPLLESSRKYYEIWIKTSSNAWQFLDKVDEVPNAPRNYIYSFKDTLNVCDEIVEFQIRLQDTVEGHWSGSNYISEQFSDKNNSDIIAISSATVDADGKSNLTWSASSLDDVIEYEVRFNDPVNGWSTIDLLPIGTPMPYVWTNSQASMRSEEFKVVSIDSCGNPSREDVTISHETMHLRANLNRCDGVVSLGWNFYKGFSAGVGVYNLYMKEDGGAPILLFTGTDQDSNYVKDNLSAGAEYCFYVEAFDANSLYSSKSNEACVIADVPKKSKILYLASVSNNYLRESIDLKAFVDGEADVKSYDIERATEENGIYSVIGTVAQPNGIPFVIDFSDFSADPEITYYYRVKAQNLCGGVESLSNTSRNIVLDVNTNPNMNNKSFWNSYLGWGGNVGRYDIYRSVNDETNYQLIASVDGDDTIHYDNILSFGNESGKFCYYIQAVEDNNPLGLVDVNGQPFQSLSNRVCVNQKAKVFVPTAFRPSSDIEANKWFGPSMRFENIESYDFYIMNRWGSIVFRTSDPNEFWDGKQDGATAPLGVYVYYLKYSTENDIENEEKGTFSLIN
tara:strand:+ start:115991 stop:119431 length:3441 start_codon:yes stop_codon:yes gene_type:complete